MQCDHVRSLHEEGTIPNRLGAPPSAPSSRFVYFDFGALLVGFLFPSTLSLYIRHDAQSTVTAEKNLSSPFCRSSSRGSWYYRRVKRPIARLARRDNYTSAATAQQQHPSCRPQPVLRRIC